MVSILGETPSSYEVDLPSSTSYEETAVDGEFSDLQG